MEYFVFAVIEIWLPYFGLPESKRTYIDNINISTCNAIYVCCVVSMCRTKREFNGLHNVITQLIQDRNIYKEWAFRFFFERKSTLSPLKAISWKGHIWQSMFWILLNNLWHKQSFKKKITWKWMWWFYVERNSFAQIVKFLFSFWSTKQNKTKQNQCKIERNILIVNSTARRVIVDFIY